MQNGTTASVTLIGHPFAPIGRGEDIRCAFRAFGSVGVDVHLLDLYGQYTPDPGARAEFSGALVDSPGDTNLFVINGDEIDAALSKIGGMPTNSRNIIYPAWELPTYPAVWLDKLALFDAVWAPSRFIQAGLSALTSIPVLHQPLPCEVHLDSMLDRRHFGIPESAYAFLFFYDLRSYTSRKDPSAVIDAFKELSRVRAWSDICLVIKLNGSSHDPAAAKLLKERIGEERLRILLIDEAMSDNAVKNLVRCTDCFVSLHRSEGFGRGMAEAMYLRKPVVATNYSGNTDFMTHDNSLPVDYRLVPVNEGEYPQWHQQFWAKSDIDHAVSLMVRLVDAPALGRSIGTRASQDIRLTIGYLPTGLRYLDALAAT